MRDVGCGWECRHWKRILASHSLIYHILTECWNYLNDCHIFRLDEMDWSCTFDLPIRISFWWILLSLRRLSACKINLACLWTFPLRFADVHALKCDSFRIFELELSWWFRLKTNVRFVYFSIPNTLFCFLESYNHGLFALLINSFDKFKLFYCYLHLT